MTRDFAKSSHKKSFPVIPVLTGVAIGCGLALIGTVLLTPIPENQQSMIQNTGVDLIEQDQAQRESSNTGVPPKEPARFKFYELLPKLEIRPFADPTPAAEPQVERTRPAPAPQQTENKQEPTPNRAASTTGTFWVQAGSFRSNDDAESRRAHLILLGFAPKVERADIQGKGTFYRVKIGPLPNNIKAREAVKRLANDGVDSYITRESP